MSDIWKKILVNSVYIVSYFEQLFNKIFLKMKNIGHCIDNHTRVVGLFLQVIYINCTRRPGEGQMAGV